MLRCFTCLAIASKYYVIHCLPIAAQYNVFWQLGTGTIMTKEATLPVFHVQIKYLSQINYLNKKKIKSIVLIMRRKRKKNSNRKACGDTHH